MEPGLCFKLGKYLQSKEELEIGKYYHFYEEVYLYCGCIPPFENAHAFGCVAGTLYVNAAQIEKLLQNKEIRHAKRAKTS